MDDLISFISNNFYFVIVIVGIIYSLFFRKSPLENKPPNRMPDFGGDGQQRPRRPGETRPPVVETSHGEPVDTRLPAPQRQAQHPARSEAALRLERELQPVRSITLPEVEHKVEDYLPQQSTRARSSVNTSKPVPSRAVSSNTLGVTKEDLTRAIVWAEILGPPRARKPFRR
ncbi:hypothetical protein [Cohnella abietis]|uniref:Uncharacterized protein n=1 Tax=Cohnella abietis TaxID=2507935 RepID=A0A3T1D9F8_9BACL|nr:hypothetical protein [Cohnella abietis]BBI34732.1 hypothetical protein KCTCHS21_41310 [Cohnella abietis]